MTLVSMAGVAVRFGARDGRPRTGAAAGGIHAGTPKRLALLPIAELPPSGRAAPPPQDPAIPRRA